MAGDETNAGGAPTHYERIGGAPTVREAVDRFYARVLGDAELAHYFAGADMVRLERHQALLLGQALGGPAAYDGRGLGEAHRGLAISDAHYDRVVGHLVAVLTELGADDEAVAAAGAVVAAAKADIVESPAAGA